MDIPGSAAQPDAIAADGVSTSAQTAGVARAADDPRPTGHAINVSVVVVSQGRPEGLRRCLLSLEQQFHPCFEVIVVADEAGCTAAKAFNAKVLQFDDQNISAARNAGIGLAAGELIAFIDDDSAAEPGWLSALTLPFSDPQIAGSGGFVLGRNGISWQWRGRQLDAAGNSYPLPVPDAPWSVPEPAPEHAVRVEGTNMAFRATVLRAHQGFDPAYRFYHDETDLCWRLHLAGEKLALVPGAVVHHGFLPSTRRRADRVPRDLREIGRGCTLFLIRFAPDRLKPELAIQRAGQRRRLLTHLRAGRCMPCDVERLLRSFDAGVEEAMSAPGLDTRELLKPKVSATTAFRAFVSSPPKKSVVMSGRRSQRKSLITRAKQARDEGCVVTILELGASALYHRMRFGDDGIWTQTGGQFGRSERSAPLVQWRRFEQRVSAERQRFAQAGRFPRDSG